GYHGTQLLQKEEARLAVLAHVLAGLADKDLVRRGLRHGIGSGLAALGKLVHRTLRPGHPARWVTSSMAGLLTSRVAASPTFPDGTGQWLEGVARRLQLRGQSGIWRLMPTPPPVPFSLGRAWLGREPSRPSVRRNAKRIKTESDTPG